MSVIQVLGLYFPGVDDVEASVDLMIFDLFRYLLLLKCFKLLITRLADSSLEGSQVVVALIALVEDGAHLPGAEREIFLFKLLDVLVVVLRERVNLRNLPHDLTHESELQVGDQARVRHVFHILLEAELSHLVDVLWLDVELLVLLHQFLALLAEFAAVSFEEATQLDQVEDRDQSATAHPNEFKHETAHGSFMGLTSVAFSPFTGCPVFIVRD